MEKQLAEFAGEIGTAQVCRTCGSELVVRDAWARWSPEYWLWELESVFDAAYCHACEKATTLVWRRIDGAAARHAIRELNDRFRREGRGNGSIVATPGVQNFGPDVFQHILASIRAFDGFSEDNDPWGEHDFGAIELGDQKVFWKIDGVDAPSHSGIAMCQTGFVGSQ